MESNDQQEQPFERFSNSRHAKTVSSYSILNDEEIIKSRSNDNEVSIRELILRLRSWYRYLRSRWLTIVIAGIIGGLVGLLYSLNKKPIYKAELSFALEDEKSGGSLGGALGLASQFGFDLNGNGGGAFSGDNLLELMKSRTLVQKALLTEVDVNQEKQTLANLYIEFNNFRDRWKSQPLLSKVQFSADADPKKFTRIQDSLMGEFHRSLIRENLTVDKVDKKLSIIAVKVSSGNELFSKHFAEVLAKEVSDFYVETKTKRSVENLAILQYQTDSVRRALNSAITGVATSIDVNPNPNPSRQLLRVPAQRKQVDVQANQAILTELVKNLEISKVSLRKETPLIQIIDRPILPISKESPSILKFTVLGMMAFVFFSMLFLLTRRFLKDILN